MYIDAANAYVDANDYKEAAACISRAAGCTVNQSFKSNDETVSMIGLIDQVDVDRVSDETVLGNLIFNRAQLNAQIAGPIESRPPVLRAALNDLRRAGDIFESAGKSKQILVTSQIARLLIDLHSVLIRINRIKIVRQNIGELPPWLQIQMQSNIEDLSETLVINPQLLGLEHTPAWIDLENERAIATLEIQAEMQEVISDLAHLVEEFENADRQFVRDPKRLILTLQWISTGDSSILRQIVDRLNEYDTEISDQDFLGVCSKFLAELSNSTHLSDAGVVLLTRFARAYRNTALTLSPDDLHTLVKQSPVTLRFASFALAKAGQVDAAIEVLDTARQLLLSKTFPHLQLAPRMRSRQRTDGLVYLIAAPAGTALILKSANKKLTRILQDVTSKTLTCATSAITPGSEGLLPSQELRNDITASIIRSFAICQPAAIAILEMANEANLSGVTLLTTGTAGLLPWSAVPVNTDGLPLGEAVELAVTPFSLSALENVQRPIGNATAFALSNEGANAPLPGVAKEAQRARACLERLGFSTEAVNIATTREAILSALQNSVVVHIATHSGLEFGNPLASGIVADDGQVTALELLHIDSSSLELAVLSSCESGKVNPFYLPDDVLSLQACLLYSGARRVLASLWPVSDTATLLLMSYFYKRLETYKTVTTSSVRRSLFSAQQWMRRASLSELKRFCAEEDISSAETPELYTIGADQSAIFYESPQYWAAFCLMVRDLPVVG
ncbi:CHAT domain-containing protein [Nocardia farcinica]|uniref:CHAT domain-containing protein n=1 Tax=Nocardia farcinica TaxID=37329 RepID=UPI0018960FA1|nr:CHAT domain-containing protein [Nocardia farcinica]MBF6143680.1 CHAT domain-containing protein [Nocardia farcinica]MBF6384520.1 CHAT domain-containing protein [Nocardia farcinica]MBF6539727.1 CHAT domain-containing protein [Nocardia farcinica]